MSGAGGQSEQTPFSRPGGRAHQSPAKHAPGLGVEQEEGSRRPNPAPPTDLPRILREELLRVLREELLRADPMMPHSLATYLADMLAGPLADWIHARFLAWAQQGMETLEGSDYWSRQVDL